MIIDATLVTQVWEQFHRGRITAKAPLQLIKFLEKKLGGLFIYENKNAPFGRTDLIDLWEIAEKLRAANVIKNIFPIHSPPDEPRFPQWVVECATPDKHTSGGMSTLGEREALIPALAEAVERYIWMTETDYFISPRLATESGMRKRKLIPPHRFAGYTSEQRSQGVFRITSESKFLWTRGHSHVSKGPIWIPAQVVSGRHGVHATRREHEPTIIQPITTGLATGPTRKFALLNGALEILERDAFMITWLNQLSAPRIDLILLSSKNPEIYKLLTLCKRYRLSVTAVLLPTDAPAYAVGVIIEDTSGVGPDVTVGLRAHRSIYEAVKGACLEALRIRQTIKKRAQIKPLDPAKKGSDIVHLERAQYWSKPGSARKLDFLLQSQMIRDFSSPWENDSIEEHWERIVAWCKDANYECASVDLGRSKSNVSPWKIEMVVMPDMQPMHQTEKLVYLGGKRLREIPIEFGYEPRKTPFVEEPHPFA